MPKLDEHQAMVSSYEDCRRVIAAAAHKLRQPLQTLSLLHGLLVVMVKDDETLKVVSRIEGALDSMAQILNTLNNPNTLDSLLASREEPVFSSPEQPDLETKKIVPITQEDKAQQTVVYIVDDNASVREGMGDLLRAHGHSVELFESCETFLAARRSDRKGCLVVDALLPGMSGLDLLKQLREQGDRLPAIMITGRGDIALAVQAMKAGACDFIEKPIGSDELLRTVTRAIQDIANTNCPSCDREVALERLNCLSERERQIMALILDGHPNKNIAADLGISQRTVESHRANIMRKTGSKTLPALLRLAMNAA